MILILNFKTYLESTGQGAIDCAQAAFNFSRKSNHTVIVCPQTIDIENILERFTQDDKFKVWSQHMDYQRGDKETGFLTIETLKKIGVTGSLVNHAEHKINAIGQYAGLDKEMDLCFCISNLLELSLAIGRNPEFHPKHIAFEPPNLIGGDISVSQANPMDIEKIVDQFHNFNILVGAGIKNNEDVKTSIKLGAKGILITSGYVFAKDKEKFLEELTAGV